MRVWLCVSVCVCVKVRGLCVCVASERAGAREKRMEEDEEGRRRQHSPAPPLTKRIVVLSSALPRLSHTRALPLSIASQATNPELSPKEAKGRFRNNQKPPLLSLHPQPARRSQPNKNTRPMSAGRLAPALAAFTVAGGALATYTGAFGPHHPEDRVVLGPVPTRGEAVARLKDSSPDRPFDVLIIGGGATGAGCAVDAATR